MAKKGFYIRRDGADSYKIFDVNQTSKDASLYVHPVNTVYFPNSLILDASPTDRLVFEHDSATHVDHFSLHSTSGQRHVKSSRSSLAIEPIKGPHTNPPVTAIPLFTMVALAENGKPANPNLPSGSLGVQLAKDCNYLIVDAVLTPKGQELQNSFEGYRIDNVDHSSVESFGRFKIELNDCDLFLFTRTSNYELTQLPNGVLYRQNVGKTVAITRVTNSQVLAQVTDLRIVNINGEGGNV